MASEFRLPDIGEGLTGAEIVRWHIAPGEPVAADQPLVEIETDKSIVDIPSPYAGTLLHRGAAVGETLPVGAVLAVIGAAGETWPPAGSPGPAEPGGTAGAADRAGTAGAADRAGTAGAAERAGMPGPADRAGTAGAAPIVGTLREQAQDLTRPAPPPGPVSARPRALPLVRKLAASLGVDLREVVGTGPHGTVTRADVTAAAAAPAEPARADDERRPLSRLRRTIAANLTRAWAEIPMVTAFDEVPVGRLLAARAALQRRHGVRVPIDALLIAAVIPVLRAYPEFNASLDGDTLVLHHRHDIGIAVDTPDGLLVAVLADAGRHRLLALAAEVRRLGAAARARSLPPAELTGQTFTISNVGAIGGGHGTPLVPLGTTGILAAGRATPKPVVDGSTVRVAPMLPLSLSYDHRVIDGALGRRFLAMLAEQLAEPVLFLA
jgi:pyruvate dehydrogenase E2 component (dihydrolipoamide acetyltransferase)